MINRLIFLVLICTLIVSCNNSEVDRYNILWLTCEDISPTLSMYGDSTVLTPTLDKLASQSMIFDNAFSVVGVCAPSRSCLITGMYPTSIGTHNMRTGKDYAGWGTRNYDGNSNAFDINGDSVPLYSAVIPDYVKCFTEYLRAAGYYCINNVKTDYQFAAPVTAWDENGPKAHWHNRGENQPFFAVFNHEVTHESRMWINKNLPQTVNPDKVPLPDYFPENDVVRTDVARNYSNIELLDKQLNKRIEELDEAGLLENTIVFFFSDHGGPLPRGKREHYDSGLKVPLMIRMPGSKTFERITDLVSFVDFAPTVLSLAGIRPPEYMQGQAFLGKFKADSPRKNIYGTSDRFDEFTDRSRIIRSERYLFVKNFHPERPSYKDVGYRKQMDMMNELLRLRDAGELNEKQAYFFRTEKTTEEFYDCWNDPYQLNNLIGTEEYSGIIDEMRQQMNDWIDETNDMGKIPELELFYSMWPNGEQPKTEKPKVEIDNNTVIITSQTSGSSLAYIISDDEIIPDLNSGWKLYTKPIKVQDGKHIYVLATRIGYIDSDVLHYSF